MKASNIHEHNIPENPMPVSVLEYLEKSALIYPDSPAFCSVSEQLTFGQLREQAQILGWKIRDSIKQDSSPLAVLLMERQPHAVTALAGILYAGGSYVFLDPSLPEKRLKELMDFLKPDVCLADRKYLATAEHIWEKPLCLETLTQNATRPESPERSRLSEPSLSPERSRLSEQPLSPEQSRLSEPSLSPEQTLCLTFTSSSSGQPKCVETSHLSVIRYIEGLSDILEADRQTVFGEQAPLFLDASLKEIYTTLKNGCQTWFLPEELFSDPLGLTVFLNEHAVNTICWVSSALHLFAVWDVFSELLPETLRTVAFGSESLPPESLAVWRAALPKTRFLNLYGPTEATGMSLYYPAPAGTATVCAEQSVTPKLTESGKCHSPSVDSALPSIPVGKPFPGVEILLLTESGEPVPAGGIGEIYLRSNRLAKGYYQNKELTELYFLPDPAGDPDFRLYRTGDRGKFLPDGNLLFLGRTDQQVKRMGYRIDLTELERLAYACELTELACCVQKTDGRIVLYLSPAPQSSCPHMSESSPDTTTNTTKIRPDTAADHSASTDTPASTEAGLRDAVWTILRNSLPRHQLPNQITVLPELPRLPGGKLDRARMRAM